MTEGDPVAEALALLRRKHDALMADVRHVEDGIEALERLSGSSHTVLQAKPERSIRTMALDLMNEKDRDWSVAEILDEYERRGTPVHGKDPNNALRAAIADAHKAKVIFRTSIGRYKAVQFRHPPHTTPNANGGGSAEELAAVTGSEVASG